MNSFQAVTRTIIMFGTIVVGVMAWQVYGPPPEKLAPIVNRAVELAHDALGREQPAEEVEPLPLAPPRLLASDEPVILPLPAGAALRVDTEVALANHAEPLAAEFGSASEEIEALLNRLQRLGAEDAELRPWGASGQTYRCQCRMALVENPALERHFDAIGLDPQSAVEQVLSEVERWRQGPNH